MRITIHQPAFFPWLGLMSKINCADVYVCLNNVQFSKNSFDNRNKILLNGEPRWLTVPVETKGKFGDLALNKIRVANNNGKDWKKSHLDLITQAYGGVEGMNEWLMKQIVDFYSFESDKLFDYSIGSMDILRQHLDIKKQVFFSDQMNLTSTGSQLILDICKKMNADEYLSGPFGRNYLDRKSFYDAGIKLLYHDFDQEYNLSALHYLFTWLEENTLSLMEGKYKIFEEVDYSLTSGG